MKALPKSILWLCSFLLIAGSADARFISVASVSGDTNKISDIRLEKGEAAVWYLFHAGWAVKTANALLIFDYLSDGFITPKEIKDLKVYVFISHGHGDHFDPQILEWKKVIPDITYIFGWQGQESLGYEAFSQDRESRSIGALKAKNIFHNFDNIPESAFLIEVDGLTIYFSGDHGSFAGTLKPAYTDNIDYLAGQSDFCDLVFLSIFGSPTYDGELYAIEKFKPRVVLPMHSGGREADGKDFVTYARSKFPDCRFWFPSNKGDGFIYKKKGNII